MPPAGHRRDPGLRRVGESLVGAAEMDAGPTADRASPVGRRTRRAVTLTLLVLLALGIAVFARFETLEVPTRHIDGAFQTGSGLFRLLGGELPGRDFYPYLGAGLIEMLFPVFLLGGGTEGSALLSAYAFAAAAVVLLAAVLWTLLQRPRSSFAPVVVGVATFLAVLGIGAAAWLPADVRALLAPIVESIVPGQSLRPLRAAAPLLLVLVVLVARRFGERVTVLCAGAAVGVVAALWANDYALVSAAAFVVAAGYLALRKRRFSLRSAALGAGAAVVGAAVFGAAATGLHYLDYASYNFRDVLGDQFWYFGGAGQSNVVGSPKELWALIERSGTSPAVLLLVLAVIVALRYPSGRSVGVAYLGLVPFGSALLALLNGHIDDYFGPFRLWAVLTAVLGVTAVAVRAAGRLSGWGPRRPRPTALAGALTAGVIAVTAVLVPMQWYRERDAYLAGSPDHAYRPELGGYLPLAFAAHVDATPAAGTRVLEEYAGLWMAESRTNSSNSVDAVIHALGAQRAPFASSVARAAEVVSTVPAYDPGVVSWSLSANWWFYKPLFQHFRPSQDSPATMRWTRASGSLPAPTDGICTVDSDQQALTVLSATTGLHEIRVRYDGPGRGRHSFAMLENGIVRLEGSNGAVPLDPGARAQAVPVFLQKEEARHLRLFEVGAPANTHLLGCTVMTVPVADHDGVMNDYGWILQGQ